MNTTSARLDKAVEGEDLARAAIGAQQGAREDFHRLVELLGPRVYRFLVVRLKHESDAQDALQETLIAAWESLPRLRRPESVRAWFFTIALRKAAEVIRLRPDLSETLTSEAVTPDPTGQVELRLALDGLPTDMRDVLLLRYLVGLSEEETASALGVRLGTVKSRSARARERLAVEFSDTHTLD